MVSFFWVARVAPPYKIIVIGFSTNLPLYNTLPGYGYRELTNIIDATRTAHFLLSILEIDICLPNESYHYGPEKKNLGISSYKQTNLILYDKSQQILSQNNRQRIASEVTGTGYRKVFIRAVMCTVCDIFCMRQRRSAPAHRL